MQYGVDSCKHIYLKYLSEKSINSVSLSSLFSGEIQSRRKFSRNCLGNSDAGTSRQFLPLEKALSPCFSCDRDQRRDGGGQQQPRPHLPAHLPARGGAGGRPPAGAGENLSLLHCPGRHHPTEQPFNQPICMNLILSTVC